jgi:hypothetical protein
MSSTHSLKELAHQIAVLVLIFGLTVVPMSGNTSRNTPRSKRAATREKTASQPVSRQPRAPDNLTTPAFIAANQKTRARVSEAYGKLPLTFEANDGQHDPRVKFSTHNSGYDLFLTSTEAVMVFARSANDLPSASGKGTHRNRQPGADALRMRMVDANPQPEITGIDQLPGKTNYFMGSDPQNWHANVATYATVAYRNVYPGVDMIYRGTQSELEYDFIVAAGADPRVLNLAFDGAQKLTITESGELILRTASGEVRHHKPLVYQESNGLRKVIDAQYRLTGKRQVGFELADYDRTKSLTIDPILTFSTYLGGTGVEFANAIVVDATGNSYVVGQTDSTNFPLATPLQTTNGGGQDTFVTKLNASGTALVYSTYLGGSGDDPGWDIAVDGTGSAYVTGRTSSANFPVTLNALQSNFAGATDAFVTKLTPNGDALVYSTYLGGSNSEIGPRVDVDIQGNTYITGQTLSTDFPTAAALQGSSGGLWDAFVTKLDPTGNAFVYSTYLGGAGSDIGIRVVADSAGDAFVAGLTSSGDFPTANALQSSFGGGTDDGFVAKLNPTGDTLLYSTYLGGSDGEAAAGLAVDAEGNAYLTGRTASTNFPRVNPIQPAYGGGPNDAFVSKINATGNALIYSTYLGGNQYDFGSDLAVDSSGNAFVTGYTVSTNFPTVSPVQASYGGGGFDGFVTKLDATGSAFTFSTFLGGSGNDFSYGIAVDAEGGIYLAGNTASTNFPTSNPLQATRQGNSDAFIAKISGSNLTISGRVADAGDVGITGVTITLTGTESSTATTNANGNYTFSVGQGNYTVTPAKPNYAFSPPTQSFTGMTASQVANFTGSTSAISGHVTENSVGIDALMTLSGSQSGTVNADVNGYYSFQVTPSGSYTITPSKAGYAFTPLSQTFSNISGNQVADFSGTLRTYVISGRISNGGGAGVSDVIVNLSGSQAAAVQTDASGNYAFTNLISGGNYTVTPSPFTPTLTYTFTPTSQIFNSLSADQIANFSATAVSLVTLYPSADAYVQDGSSANTNFGTATALNLKTDSGTNNGLNRDVYLKFDLSGVSSSITNVKLRIYAALSASGSVSTSAYSVATTSWLEQGTGSITWNNKPARSGSALTGATITVNSTTYTTYDLDVTNYVKGEKTAGRDVVSLALHDGAASTPMITLNSREAAANKPQLIITTTGTDNAPPTISLTGPLNGASYTAPANITLTANATDSDGQISKVDFFAGTALIGTATVPVGSTYSVSWNGVGAGAYSLSAVATDNSGASVISNVAGIVVVAPNSPPTVSITSPTNNSNFLAGANISLAADASDIDGSITKVEFFYGGTNKIGEALSAPYGITWNNVAAASYSLTAKATDNNGATTTSSAVNITVTTPATNGEVAFVTGKTLGTLRNNLSNFAGMKITVGAEAISVMQLGRVFVAGNSGTHTIKIVKASDGSDVAGGSVSLAMAGGTAGQFKYARLSTPILLLANTAYYIVSQETSGGDQWYDSNTTLTATNAATINSGIYRNVSTWTAGGTTNHSFVPVDFKYVLASGTYHLHKEASTTAGLFQLKTVGPDGTALAVKTVELKNQATGEKLIKEFDTQAGVPNKGGVIPAGSTVTFTLWMRKTANIGTMFPRAKLNLNSSSGTSFCVVTGTTALTTTLTKYTLTGTTTAPISVSSTDRYYLWTGINLTTGSTTTNFMGELDIEGTLNGNYNSLINAPLPLPPTISSLSPTMGPVGSSLTVTGSSFGATQGTSTLTLNNVPVTVSTWTNGSIVLVIPSGATTGQVIVTVKGLPSNGVTFTVGQVDTDGDGLPDSWETLYFGNLNQTASGDFDGDGVTNLQEYLEGRNPTKGALPDPGGVVNLKVHTPLDPP